MISSNHNYFHTIYSLKFLTFYKYSFPALFSLVCFFLVNISCCLFANSSSINQSIDRSLKILLYYTIICCIILNLYRVCSVVVLLPPHLVVIVVVVALLVLPLRFSMVVVFISFSLNLIYSSLLAGGVNAFDSWTHVLRARQRD